MVIVGLCAVVLSALSGVAIKATSNVKKRRTASRRAEEKKHLVANLPPEVLQAVQQHLGGHAQQPVLMSDVEKEMLCSLGEPGRAIYTQLLIKTQVAEAFR